MKPQGSGQRIHLVGRAAQQQAKGQEMEIRVLLFAEEEIARQTYQDALAACGVRVFVTPSFFLLSEEICSQTYHGLFFDLSTKMQAIKENKADVYHLAERFPVAHLRIDRRTGEIRCFHVNQQSGGTLLDFIDSRCRTGEPRKIRTVARKEMHLPVLISRHPESKRSERAITKDISPGGCFIVSTHRWKEGGEVFLRFPELTDTAPIQAQIRTVVKWGMGRQMPGIGVSFWGLSSTQAAELETIWRLDDHR
jgi:hypothetical protein